jgi:capsular exopolysaccharide synthesis family protein
MLDRHARAAPVKPVRERSAGGGEIGLPHLINFWRRQRAVMVVITTATLLLGAIYLVIATPQYTATTALLIETRKLALFSEGDVFGEAAMSNSNLETQTQILLSARIAEAVAKKLDLVHDTEFLYPPANLIDSILQALMSWLRGGETTSAAPPGDATQLARASALLRSYLTVQRVGLSYVIYVSYTNEDRYKAAEIANAYTVAYVEDLFNAQLAIAQRGSDWLLARIRDLNERAGDESLSPKEKSAIRTTYDSFLQRYTDLVQQQSLPSTEARVITPATAGTKTSPNLLLVVAASLVLGGAMGFGVGLVRDLLDRMVRTQQEVEAATGAAFLGYLPAFNVGGLTTRITNRSRKKIDAASQKFSPEPAYSVAITAPFSHFSETLRNIKLAAEKAVPNPVVVLGITSSLPNEGKTTVAVNLARMIAQSGGPTLLIDGDLRGNALSNSIVPPDTRGLVQLVQGEGKLADLIWSDQATRLQFLPAGVTAKLSNPTDILSSASTATLLDSCRRHYDFVIVDLPAVLSAVDARAVAHLLDGLVFVVEWGAVTEDVLAQAFQVDSIADKVVGVLLNKVRIRSLKRYQERPTEIVADKYHETYRHVA